MLANFAHLKSQRIMSRKYSTRLTWMLALAAGFIFSACHKSGNESETTDRANILALLQDSLQTIAGEYPAEIGIAMLTDCGDTILVNNENKYPLMSVFKLHQAISLCNYLEHKQTSIDSVITINRDELNPDTWSPMLKDYSGSAIAIPISELLRYTLMQSDNNASNYMFHNLQSIADVDSFIVSIIPRESFRLTVTEADMWANHDLCYRNTSSPLGAAILINHLFTDSIISTGHSYFICTALKECKTGTDRIVAPLVDLKDVTVAHKTGSGFRNADGVLSAHNDVAFVQLPDNRAYTLAVFVKDFKGSEPEAAKAIARISATVYRVINNLYQH